MKRVEGKVAVITGGNSGIGKGIAKKFAEEGAKVAIFGRSLETLEKTKQELPGEILAVRGDVTNAEDLKKLFSEVEKHYGKTDILVANAGVGKKVHVEKATEEDFDYVVDINYKGVFFTVKYSIPHLNAKASILLIASTAAYEIAKGRSIYSSTKAAVSKLAQGFTI